MARIDFSLAQDLAADVQEKLTASLQGLGLACLDANFGESDAWSALSGDAYDPEHNAPTDTFTDTFPQDRPASQIKGLKRPCGDGSAGLPLSKRQRVGRSDLSTAEPDSSPSPTPEATQGLPHAPFATDPLASPTPPFSCFSTAPSSVRPPFTTDGLPPVTLSTGQQGAAPRPSKSQLRHDNYLQYRKTHPSARRKERSKGRHEHRLAGKDSQSAVASLSLSVETAPRRGSFVGKRVGKSAQRSSVETLLAGPLPHTSPAQVGDAADRLVGFRPFGTEEALRINQIAMFAVKKLVNSTPNQITAQSNPRGHFNSRFFMVSRNQKLAPANNAYMKKNLKQVIQFAEDIKPIISYIEGIFRQRFPAHHKYYSEAISKLAKHYYPEPVHFLFGPWASLAVNSGGEVVAESHTDPDNYFAGFCVILAYGNFDHDKSAFLVLDDGKGKIVRVALPAGVPFFLPSAIVKHYNTSILGDDEERGSIVLWTSGQIFQWLELDGRCVQDLEPEEAAAWLEKVQELVREAIARYPILKQSV